MEKGDEDVLSTVFPIDNQPSLELHLEKSLIIYVARDEICSLPIVG